MNLIRIRLKGLRESAGYSQAALARKLGVSQSTVGNWEAGLREPGFSAICAIADLFGVTVDYLLGRSDEPGGSFCSEPPLPEVRPGMIRKLIYLRHQNPDLYRIAVRQLDVILTSTETDGN
jgi:transcriptional regulator with XRE-family HTH domain